jgi:hypothetical protein
MKPDNPYIKDLKDISFGYESNNRSYAYNAKLNPSIKSSLESLHKFIWILIDCKRKNLLPWNKLPANVKSQLIITNINDPQMSFLDDLVTKSAQKISILKNILNWF